MTRGVQTVDRFLLSHATQLNGGLVTWYCVGHINKSVLIRAPRISIWRCPHLLLHAVLLGARRVCTAANPPLAAAEGRMGQTDGRTDGRTLYRFTDPAAHTKKGKVFPYSLPSVGPGADPGVQAVSPQVTRSESRHIPSSSLPLLSARPAFTFVSFTRWRHL